MAVQDNVLKSPNNYEYYSININPLPLQVLPRDFNLPHQLLISLRHIIERKHAPAKVEK